MKGLFLAFGLIAALFISNNVQASIYDTATYHAPKINSKMVYFCDSFYGSQVPDYDNADLDECAQTLFSNYLSRNPSHLNCSYKIQLSSDSKSAGFFAYNCTYSNGTPITQNNYGRAINGRNLDSVSCPPDSFPNYTYERDNNADGKPDQCYDPRELDNVSKCADLFNSGSILSTGTNVAPLVCKEFEDGSRCAFSRVNQGTTPYYQPNLEVGCFGDGNPIPKYDPSPDDPQPQPEQCVPYAGGYACAADPKNYCSSEFECVDGCGYFNGQFICFRDEQCTGASCEPAPVDCTTVPDAPVCKDQATTPEPSFCEKNPTVQSCQSGSTFCKKNPLAPSCQLGGDNGGGTGGGGGGGGFEFSLDYEKLISGMKDAAKSLIDESPIPENSEMDKSLDDENKGIKSDYDNFLENGVFNEIKATSQRTVFSSLESIFPSGSANCSFNFGEFNIEICSTAEKIRSLLYWVFAILTLIYLRHLFYSTISTNAGK
ncbi:hypothetical protein AYI92_21110 [Shewanella xiamenensis]|uniref:hypothetical protein n=1 Tax=Shewanella xiamenensis TaxID=332186 RepID=UPI0011862ABA|nr:hypothetical protein [Shewanella xiamenensis]TVL11317.1 hypothetical protein AYI91_21125 [Shewanella xiamenensis]TVL12278.1 hypothetical protein AYI90_21110 [Shewanella xiamenensis]TVL19732.1 hypothetical protein AYI92_21110 [Shewanella xiamenensis]TVL25367.1 hypothetical protein AYI93_21180 [Shewanella xiamenensis]TVO94455.1 hypothetical protein AYI89_21090 [Shewanella xiamenensis]